MTNKKAFTLTELLIALAIIGAIGGLTLPALMNSVNDRMLNTKYENTKQQIQQLVLEQFMIHKTKELSDTDFINPALILGSNNSNIEITSPDKCKKGNDTVDCSTCTSTDNCIAQTAWSTEEYYVSNIGNKTKEKRNIVMYKVTTENSLGKDITTSHHISGVRITDANVSTGTLKNGVLASYYYDTNNLGGNGTFLLDLNGSAGPNIIDRDVRSFTISNSGQIYDIDIESEEIRNTLIPFEEFIRPGDDIVKPVDPGLIRM